jgi:hypothetical protein
MSLEDEVKQAFTKHEEDARADGQSWVSVEKKVARVHRQRVALVSTLTLALIAGLAIVIPRLGNDRDNGGFANPTATPTASTAPSPEPSASSGAVPDGWQARAGVQSGFAVAIPPDWKGGWFEGYWDFEPKGYPSTSQDGNTFALSISVQPGDYHDAAAGQHTTSLTIGDRDALSWSAQPMHLQYAVDWQGCPDYATECSSNFSTRTLIVNMFGSTAELWAKYQTIGEQVVSTIRPYDGSTPAHGTIDPAAKLDAYSNTLIRFLDARVEKIGADEMTCCKVTNSPSFYDMTGYNVTTLTTHSASAATATFIVEETQPGGGLITERITVGYEDPANRVVAPKIVELTNAT